jgi:uncharacterized membrane protein
VAVGSLLALIVLGLLPGSCGWPRCDPGGSWLALKVLPLCIPLAGLLKNRMYTYRWVSLMVWLYFTEGVVRAWGDRAPSPPGWRWWRWRCASPCLSACTLHVRLRLKQRRPGCRRRRDAGARCLSCLPDCAQIVGACPMY